jgi:ABC-2 type transport system ATP-binding protein
MPGVAAPAVEVEGLVVRYGTIVAVDGLDLLAPAAQVTAVLGPNGAGKTSTMRCCEGLVRPDAGRVRVLGTDPYRAAATHRARVGVVLQGAGGVYPGAYPMEALRHIAGLHASPLDVDVLAARLGLHRSGRTPWRRLSGGERQRLAVAMAVVGRPELVVLDEPTTGLDPQARQETWALVRDLRRDGVAVLLTTHLMDEAEQLADTVVVVDHGRVVASGSPEELTGGSADADVRFSAAPRLDLASLSAALSPLSRAEELRPGRYRVHGRVDPATLATLTAWCAAHGVMPQELAVGRRTLEDVFLELTGRELRP